MSENLTTALKAIADLFDHGCEITVDDDGVSIVGNDDGDTESACGKDGVERYSLTIRGYSIPYRYDADDTHSDVVSELVERIKHERTMRIADADPLTNREPERN